MGAINCVSKGLIIALAFSIKIDLYAQPGQLQNPFQDSALPPLQPPAQRKLPELLDNAPPLSPDEFKKLRKTKQANFELLQSFAKPNVKDDELQKLQRERFAAALLELRAWSDKFEVGDTNLDAILEQLNEASKHVVCSAMDHPDSKVLMEPCLQYAVNFATVVDLTAMAKYKAGQGQVHARASARYHLRTAEIQLLKFKRANPSKK